MDANRAVGLTLTLERNYVSRKQKAPGFCVCQAIAMEENTPVDSRRPAEKSALPPGYVLE